MDEARSLLSYENHNQSEPIALPIAEDWIGKRAGQYRIIGHAGEGGMGVVWAAVRDDGQFERRVAVKFLHGIAPNSLSLDRFLKERDILARLDHPNIARLVDAGLATGFTGGQPYLVLDWVEGKSIDQYVKDSGASIHETLRLFRQVCAAVDYAHRQLVVHRDVKPSNVLVTGNSEVKLLDFGVAKILDAGLSDAQTSTMFRAMTPDYSSPEQVRGEPASTSDDVYSLGVLLYELLARERPYHFSTKTLNEIVAGASWRTPSKPSSKREGLSAELDAIVLKAMHPDRDVRYGSVRELAADIDNYLEGRPVRARPASAWYTARKFIRRNKRITIVAAALVLSVLAGATAFLLQARIVERERALAQSRFSEARRLIDTVIFDIQPKMERLPGATALRVTLLNGTLHYLEELGKNSGNDPAFLRDLIGSYTELARVQGNLAGASVGDKMSAQRSLDSAAKLLRRLLEIDRDGPDSLRAAVRVYMENAQQLMQSGNTSEASRYAALGVTAAEQLDHQRPTAETKRTLANALFTAAGASNSIETYRRSLGLYESLLQQTPGDAALLRDCALVHKSIASIYVDQGKREAMDETRMALDLDTQTLTLDPTDPRAQLDRAIDLSLMANNFADAGNMGNAISYMSQSLEVRQKIFDANPDDVRSLDRLAWAVSTLAVYRSHQNLVNAQTALLRAESLYRTLKSRTELADQSVGSFALVELLLGRLERRLGNTVSSCAHIRESLALFEQYKGMPGAPNLKRKEEAQIEGAACGGH